MATDVKRPAQTKPPMVEDDQPVAVRLRALQLSEQERRADGGSWRRRIGWTAALLTIAAAASAGIWYRKTVSAELPEIDVVAFGQREREDIVLDLTGNIMPHRRVNITPRSAGTIISFPVEEGQEVKKGDLVAQVDDTTYRAEYEQARAGLATAEAQLEELKNGPLNEELESARALVEQARAGVEMLQKDVTRKEELSRIHERAVTEAEMEQLRSKLRESLATLRNQEQQLALLEKGARQEKLAAAQAEVDRNKALVTRAQYWLDNTKLTSPIDGVVLEKKAEAGEDVHPELVFTSLCVIADLKNMEAAVDVSEDELHRLKIGQPCEVVPDAFSQHRYQGELVRILPIVNRARGVVPVKIKILNPDNHLLVDMNCHVIFKRHPDDAQDHGDRLPTVPKTAVLNQDGKSFVYVVQDQVARKRAIEVGNSTADEVEVRSGLAKGDLVLISAGNVQDGQAVRPRVQAAG